MRTDHQLCFCNRLCDPGFYNSGSGIHAGPGDFTNHAILVKEFTNHGSEKEIKGFDRWL